MGETLRLCNIECGNFHSVHVNVGGRGHKTWVFSGGESHDEYMLVLISYDPLVGETGTGTKDRHYTLKGHLPTEPMDYFKSFAEAFNRAGLCSPLNLPIELNGEADSRAECHIVVRSPATCSLALACKILIFVPVSLSVFRIMFKEHFQTSFRSQGFSSTYQMISRPKKKS